MQDPVAAPNGHALVAHYEALRHVVVDSGGGYTARGRALLMRKGMAAWMNGLEVASPQAAAPRAASAERQWPTGIEKHLVDILTTMALATAMEIVA